MVNGLENKIAIALKATQFQMMHSDAKEGLSYMHECVEEQRELGNPWDDPLAYYKRHLEIVSFLKDLGFTEFDDEQLRLTYNGIVDAVYWPKVLYDPQPGTQVTAHKAEENSLQKQLVDAKSWSDYLSKNNPLKDPTKILNLSNGVYITKDVKDLVKILHEINNKSITIAESKQFLNGIFEEKCDIENCYVSYVMNGLNEYEKRKPAFLEILILFGPWFGSPIFGIGDIFYALTNDFVHLKKKVEEKQTYRNADYLNNFPKVRDKVMTLWHGTYLANKYSDLEGLRFLDFGGFIPGTQTSWKSRCDAEKAEVNILYHLLQEVKAFNPDVEKAFNKYVNQIKEQYIILVKKWSEEEERISFRLQKLSEDREVWLNLWAENCSGLKKCAELKQNAINNPLMSNTHPIFNTSAYLARLVSLSVQLEALQNGISLPSSNRLLARRTF